MADFATIMASVEYMVEPGLIDCRQAGIRFREQRVGSDLVDLGIYACRNSDRHVHRGPGI
jgi:hypothetical protein